MAPTGAERFTIIACADGAFIVTDPAFARGMAVVLPDSAAVLRHCVNIIKDERDRAAGRV